MARAFKGVISAHLRRFFQGGARFYCNNSLQNQEIANKYVQSTDLLYSNLRNAPTTRTVLEMVAQHNGIMNDKHIVQALRSLFILQKNGNSEWSTNEILAHRDFKRLCRKLRNQAPAIELNEIIEALKVVSYVGVPSDSTIFQVLLQIIRHKVNNLNLKQIIFLDFLLSQASPSPLVEALKIALPMVFEIHLPQKLEYDNVAHLAECLYFASRNNLQYDSVERIVDALMRHHHFDGKTAKSIVWSICDMDANDLFRPLMKKAIDSMVVHFDEINFGELESTLSKLISRFSKRHSYFYDEVFYDSCANYVIDKDLGYKQSIYLLRKFGRVNFFHKFLLDYMCKKLNENPALLSNADPADIYSIAIAASMTDYRPPFWDTVKNLILQSGNIAGSDKKEIIWIKFAASLCLVDIYKLDVINKCLSETFLKQLFSKKRFMSDFENYSTVWQCIKFLKPELNCLLSKTFEPETLTKSYRQELDFVLEPALHKALGGDTYVKTGIHSKNGIQIDHAVVFRKGGYPVAMNFPEDLEFIEDVEVPADHQLVAIMGLRNYNYILNNKIVRSSTSLAIKVLEMQGVSVVAVDIEGWQALPDFEKIPYLMRAIKEKTESHSCVSESVV